METPSAKKVKMANAILELLKANGCASTGQLAALGGRSHSRRVSDLRARGHVIEIIGPKGEDNIYEYRGHKPVPSFPDKKLKYRKPIDSFESIQLPNFALEGPLGHEMCPTCGGTGLVKK